jgi:hypothetical protein
LKAVGLFRSTTTRVRRPSHLALAVLYVFVLLGSAFLHHDFDCHEKSRTHCTSCVFSQAAAGVAAEAPAVVAPELHTTQVVRAIEVVHSASRLFDRTGRAPPLA